MKKYKFSGGAKAEDNPANGAAPEAESKNEPITQVAPAQEQMPSIPTEEAATASEQPASAGAPKDKRQSTILYIIIGVVVAAVVVALILFTRGRGTVTIKSDDDEEELFTEQPEEMEEIACNTDMEEASKVKAYKVINKGEAGFELLFEYEGKFSGTGIIYTGCVSVDIPCTVDFDGDGNMDCLVNWNTGGNCYDCAGTDLVYFDEAKGFRKIEGIEYTSIEDWKGQPSIVDIDGLTMHRYTLKDGKLDESEKKSYNPGKATKTFRREQLFSEDIDDEEDREIEVAYDIDGDGEDDTIVFYHSGSHAMNYGLLMGIQDIRCSSGISSDWGYDLGSGETFSILENKTKGMPDVLIDNKLYRWNGTNYQGMKYNGRKLVVD